LNCAIEPWFGRCRRTVPALAQNAAEKDASSTDFLEELLLAGSKLCRARPREKFGGRTEASGQTLTLPKHAYASLSPPLSGEHFDSLRGVGALAAEFHRILMGETDAER
jgi:hypothetical protein